MFFITIFIFIATAQVIRFPPHIKLVGAHFTGNMTLSSGNVSETFQLIGQTYLDHRKDEKVYINVSMTDYGNNFVISSWIHFGGSVPPQYQNGISDVLTLSGPTRSPYSTCNHLTFNISTFYSECGGWQTKSFNTWEQVCNVTNLYPGNVLLDDIVLFMVVVDESNPTIPILIQTRTLSKNEQYSSILKLRTYSVDENVPVSVWTPPKNC